MRGGFRGIGTPGLRGAVPASMGGNALNGRGIPFTYSTPVLASLAAGATSTSQNIQFDANSVFVWLRSTAIATIGSAAFVYDAIPIPNINVTIQDTGKGASLMNTPVPLYHIASPVPGLPFILPVPVLIAANSTWAWTFTNYDTAQTYSTIQFNLQGFRVFDPNISSLSDLGM